MLHSDRRMIPNLSTALNNWLGNVAVQWCSCLNCAHVFCVMAASSATFTISLCWNEETFNIGWTKRIQYNKCGKGHDLIEQMKMDQGPNFPRVNCSCMLKRQTATDLIIIMEMSKSSSNSFMLGFTFCFGVKRPSKRCFKPDVGNAWWLIESWVVTSPLFACILTNSQQKT